MEQTKAKKYLSIHRNFMDNFHYLCYIFLIHLNFLLFFFCGTGVELRASHLLGRCSTTSATLPALFCDELNFVIC
jgi:hypothetical protein